MQKKRYFKVALKFLFVVPALLGYSKAYAQFNDTTHYHAAYLSSGSINKTNDGTAYLLNNALKFNVKKKISL